MVISSSREPRSTWNSLKLRVRDGGLIELTGRRGNVLASSINKRHEESDIIDNETSRRAAIVAALALQFRASSSILSRLAVRRLNNECSPHTFARNFLSKNILGKLHRLIGLCMRRDFEFGDGGSVIQLLAVTFEKTTFVYEKKELFGLLNTYESTLNPNIRSEFVLPIFNSEVGQQREVDKALLYKKPPKTRSIVEATNSLLRALEDLPEGLSSIPRSLIAFPSLAYI